MIFLFGIKNCGKSTIGLSLAKELNLSFVDLDAIIEKISHKTCRELYTQDGKEAFMQAEEKAVRFVLGNAEYKDAIVATGGGLCDNEKALAALCDFRDEFRASDVVCGGTNRCLEDKNRYIFIQVDEKTAFERIKNEQKLTGSWPAWISKDIYDDIASIKATFAKIYKERTKKYEALCKKLGGHTIIAQDDDFSKMAVSEILKIL